MAGGAETPNIAALPAIARLGACESARGPDADRRVKLLIQFAVEGALSGAYSHIGSVQLASGRFAMIDDGLGFSLVPWRPFIEKEIGRKVMGVRGTDVSWQLGRKLGLGI